MKNQAALEAFRQHLIASGKAKTTVDNCMQTVRRFLKHVGEVRLDRLSEDVTRSFFVGIKGQNRMNYASAVSQFLQFSARGLPAPIGDRGSERIPVFPVKDRKEIALRQAWAIEQAAQEKEAAETLVAQLARQLINHFLYFQRRVKGEPENLDDLFRFRSECQELIQANLPLFMELSARGLTFTAYLTKELRNHEHSTRLDCKLRGTPTAREECEREHHPRLYLRPDAALSSERSR